MSMNTFSKRSKLWLYALPIFALALVVTLGAVIRPYNASFAWGLWIGGLIGTAIGVGLQISGRLRRGGGPGRLALGKGDERDNEIIRIATSVAGLVVFGVAVAMSVAVAIHPFRAVAALSILLWTYLIALVVTYAVAAHRL